MKRVIVGLLLLAATTSHASDWQFYGSARVWTFLSKRDFGEYPYPSSTWLTFGQQENARIGARVKVSDQLHARFEYSSEAKLRILYGEWDFGAGSLLVGQTYSPLNINYSNQAIINDNNLTDFGGVYSSRNPMIRLAFGGFQIALLEPDNTSVSGLSDTKTVIPKIEAKYRLKGGAWEFQIAGGYHSYEVENGTATYDIDAYILTMGGRLRFGQFLLAGTLWGGLNAGSYAIENNGFSSPTIDNATGRVNNNDGCGYTLMAGYTINNTFHLEAGYGYVRSDLDDGATMKNEMYAYYLQSKITLAQGVYIVPEIGLISWGVYRNLDIGDIKYCGAKWQIDFLGQNDSPKTLRVPCMSSVARSGDPSW